MNAEQLRLAFKQLQPLPPGRPDPYTWDRHRYELRRHVAKDDIDNFLRWSTIQATMFVGEWELTDQELLELMSSLDREAWIKAIEEPGIGNPPLIDGWTSGNLIHQAYHLKQWQDVTGRKVSDLRSVAEFGGGYGAMALVFSKLGFTGSYLIQDLPEFALLQEYYTRRCGVNALCISRLFQLQVPEDVLIACYSLSEVSRELRSEVLKKIPANSYLFAFQDVWDGLDMREEFSAIVAEMGDVSWTWIANKNLPGHYYLIGEKCVLKSTS